VISFDSFRKSVPTVGLAWPSATASSKATARFKLKIAAKLSKATLKEKRSSDIA
jgi:hypothetical protein